MEWLPGLQGTNINFDFTENDTWKESSNYDFNFLQSPDSVYILKGDSNIFNSIWCDPGTSLNDGTIYFSTGKDLTIIQISNGQAFVKDYYTKTTAGSTGQTLDDETTADVVVNFT